MIETIGLMILLCCLYLVIHTIKEKSKNDLAQNNILSLFNEFKTTLHQQDKNVLSTLAEHQQKNIAAIDEHIKQQMLDLREQIHHSFKNHAESLSLHVGKLNTEVKDHLKHISSEVNKQLNEGFEKTTITFSNVIKRLTIIDEAQKKITELSTHVVDLQGIFQDKRARGAFGEVQLEQLIKNTLPKQHYALQYTLSNQKRADCILFLPDPTGHIIIDAKFPLESYQQLYSTNSEHDKKKYQAQFKQDIKKHILDIASKYIIKNETSEGAIMFIPAEAIFAEIHSHYPELVNLAHQQHVWLASPSTLMAILTTASAVIKDDATKKQVHIMQKHLNLLASDFARFEKRMDNLSRHITQANQDVSDIHTSAKKISQRFNKIEQLDIPETEPVALTSVDE